MPNNIPTNTSEMATGELNAFEKLRLLKEKARKAEEAMEAEKRTRQLLEEANAKVLSEKSNLLAEKAELDQFVEKATQLAAQKDALDNQLRTIQGRVSSEEEARNNLIKQREKAEQEIAEMMAKMKELEQQAAK